MSSRTLDSGTAGASARREHGIRKARATGTGANFGAAYAEPAPFPEGSVYRPGRLQDLDRAVGELSGRHRSRSRHQRPAGLLSRGHICAGGAPSATPIWGTATGADETLRKC